MYLSFFIKSEIQDDHTTTLSVVYETEE